MVIVIVVTSLAKLFCPFWNIPTITTPKLYILPEWSYDGRWLQRNHDNAGRIPAAGSGRWAK